jgi:hypothetical protein
MGFNAMQPGRVKKGDIIFFVSGIVVLVALIVWAIR